MHEDYIDFGIGMRVYLGDLEAFNIVEIDKGALVCTSSSASSLLRCTVHQQGLYGLTMLGRCSPCSVYRIRCIRPGSGYGSGSLYTTAASPYLCVMTEDTPGR
jgi:hypothetical protein